MHFVRRIITCLLVCFAVTAKAEVLPCDTSVMIPSAFTPNGDGIPEPIKPVFTDSIPYLYTYTVFNRWGQVVFESQLFSRGWNGRYFNKGNVQPDGVYLYTLRYNYSEYGAEHECSGTIQCLGLAEISNYEPVQEEEKQEADTGDYTYPYFDNLICPDCCTEKLNTFSPDFLFPPVSYTMQIFDRWGNLLFETDDSSAAWNGTNHGEKLPEGVYVWKITAVLQPGEPEKKFAGTISLIHHSP